MAKTPEQKAAEQAAKDLKKAEKAAVEQLKAAQKAELLALEEQGVSKAEIKAEKKDNKVELKDAKTLIKEPGSQVADVGIQTLLPNNKSVILSNAGTYSGETAAGVNELLNTAAANYSTYGVNNVSKSGNTTVGVGIDKLVKYELGDASKSINKLMDRAKTYVGQSFTEDQLKDAGVKVKEVKGMPGVYQWKTSGGEVQNYTFFIKDPTTGQFVGTGVNRTYTPDTTSGFVKFLSSDLGKVAMLGASIFGAPYLGSLVTGMTNAAVNAAVGNAIISASTSALSGGDLGDIARSAITAVIASDAGFTASGMLPVGLNDAIVRAVQGAASSATGAVLNGASLNEALQAGLQGAAIGAIGSGIQQIASDSGATATQTGTSTDTTYADGLSYDPGEGYGTGTLPGGNSTSDVTNFFGDTSGQTTIPSWARAGVDAGTIQPNYDGTYTQVYDDGSYQTFNYQGNVVDTGTSEGLTFQPSKVTPTQEGVLETLKGYGDKVYNYAIENPWTTAAIVAGIMTVGDLVSAAGADVAAGGGGKKDSDVVVDPLVLDTGSVGAAGTNTKFGGTYGTPVFTQTPGTKPEVFDLKTYEDRALLGDAAKGSPIARSQGIVGLAAPSNVVPEYVAEARPAENISPEGRAAADIASLLDAQAAARYNAAPVVMSGEASRAGESSPMREGGVAELAKYGRYGDTMLAHINPQEARMLKAMGGAGTVNPVTGLPEFYGIGDLTDDLRKGIKSVGNVVRKVVKPIAPYVPYIAPFVPGLNLAQATMLSAGLGAIGGDKSFDLKRGLMSGLTTYGVGSLAEGLSAAGDGSMGQGFSRVTSNAPGAREAFAGKFGTGTAMAGIMGASGVAAVDEQNAYAAQQEKLLAEAEDKRRRQREQAMSLINQYPIRFAAEGGEITDEPGYDFAAGGALPPRFLSGGGDGMSDSIPANIEGVQEARLADGEFVIPADVVSHLGNGSSKAGADQLYSMMDRIREARTGTTRQAPEVNPMKFMPA